MRLSTDNYDSGTVDVVSSNLTKEMNTKIMIFSYSINDALAVKVHSIMKREFSVVYVQNTKSTYKYPVVSYQDIEQLCAYIVVNGIQSIILTGEFVMNVVKNKEKEVFLLQMKKLVDFCRDNGIKIIYISIEKIFDFADDKATFWGIDADGGFEEVNHILCADYFNFGNNLILYVSTFYGIHELFTFTDFPEYVYQQLLKSRTDSYDNFLDLYPVLSDEIAMYLCKNFEKSGSVTIKNENCRMTLYTWAEKIAEARELTGVFGELVTRKQILPEECDKIGNTKERAVLAEGGFSEFNDGYRTELKQKKCAFNLIYKLRPLEYFFDERVATARISLGEKLANSFDKEIISKIDFIVPVPETGLYYAMGLSKKLGIPYLEALLKDTNEIRSFQILDSNVRKEIIKNKIIPIQELIKGKNIILVDEAIFTGTTLKVVSEMLKECGVNEIHLGIPTPECREQCPYYVQPKRLMLLEYIQRDMLEDYFEVESITFQAKENLREKVSELGNACMQCFMGEE